MSEYYGVIRSDDAHLEHHGIKGQKWGVRRYDYVAKGIYQKHPEGYDYNDNRSKLSTSRNFRKGTDPNYRQELKNTPKTKSQVNKDKVKTAVGIGIAVAGTALAAYGAYKLRGYMKANNKAFNDLGKDLARKAGEAKSSLDRYKENLANAKLDRAKAFEEGLKSHSIEKRKSQASELLKFMEENSNNSKSANINKMAERWLNGENFYGEKGQATDSIDYFKDLMKRSGYVKSAQQTKADVAKSSLEKVREVANSLKQTNATSSTNSTQKAKETLDKLTEMAKQNQSALNRSSSNVDDFTKKMLDGNDDASNAGREALEKLLKKRGIRTKGLL